MPRPHSSRATWTRWLISRARAPRSLLSYEGLAGLALNETLDLSEILALRHAEDDRAEPLTLAALILRAPHTLSPQSSALP